MSLTRRMLVVRTAAALVYAGAVVGIRAELLPAGAAPAMKSATYAVAGTVIRVGPTRPVKTIAEAAQLANDGDTVEIDAATYLGDVAIWRQSNLTIRGIRGPDGARPVLDAHARSAGGKGIFVVQGHNVVVQGLEFRNARVPDRNGAGIRAESTRLTVRDAVFRSNETGILAYYNPAAVLEVHDSQFIGNGFRSSDGQAHSIYVGEIGRLVIQGSYLTGTELGHLIKSRAHETRVLYSRITGESGTNSYEVDLPNGGVAYLIGNLIEQGASTRNKAVIAFGEEGLFASRPNRLHLSHNTLVSRVAGWCTWVHAPSGGWVKVINNVMLGGCVFNVASSAAVANNSTARASDFVDAASYDYRLRPDSALAGTAVDAGYANEVALAPVREYRHVATSVALESAPWSPGAFQSAR